MSKDKLYDRLAFPEQFDELWHKIEEIAQDAIDNHHDCGGGEDALIIANEVRRLIAERETPPKHLSKRSKK